MGWVLSLCDHVPLPKTTGKEYGTESLEKLDG